MDTMHVPVMSAITGSTQNSSLDGCKGGAGVWVMCLWSARGRGVAVLLCTGASESPRLRHWQVITIVN